jgi:cytochrome P450
MVEAEAAVFNPFEPGFRVDPYPAYARLRAEAPVLQAGFGSVVVSRYDDCVALARDPRLTVDARKTDQYRMAVERGIIDPDQEALMRTPPFLVLDPPDHTRLRGLVSKAFTPRVVEGMRSHVEEVVGERLDCVVEQGSFELVEDLAYALPVTVICEMLGVPATDQEVFKDWSRELSRGLDPLNPEAYLVPELVEQRRAAGNAFIDYFRALIVERRQRPADDLLSALLAAEEAGQSLTEDELLSTCLLLLAAGHETTVNLIANGLYALLQHPEQLERLRREPELAASAVEELLRFDAPVQMAVRTALEEFDVRGVTVRRGQQVLLLLGSANRDEAQFADADRLDIARNDSRHLAFGFGIHFCLGAPLARLEGAIAFRQLATRFLSLEVAGTPEYRENIVLRGLKKLPLAFEAA